MPKSVLDDFNDPEFPIRVLLVPSGKTAIAIKPCDSQLFLAGRFCALFGEPELMGPMLEGPDKGWEVLLFDHQDIPDWLRPVTATVVGDEIVWPEGY